MKLAHRVAVLTACTTIFTLAPLAPAHADAPTPEQQWASVVQQIVERDHVTPDEASQRLANLLAWNNAVNAIMVRDGVSFDTAATNLARLLASIARGSGWHDVAIAAGWSEAQWPKVACIIERESNGDPNARSRTRDSGLMQINDMHVGWLTAAGIISSRFDLFDPVTNLRAAKALYERAGGWGPWVGGRRC